jgi:hypothetical protein
LKNRPLHQKEKEGRSRVQHLQGWQQEVHHFNKEVHNWLKESMPKMEMSVNEQNEQVSTSFFVKSIFFRLNSINHQQRGSKADFWIRLINR